MDHRSMHGVEPLDPPSPEVARLYLDQVEAVEQRRERRIDRRAVAWQTILSAAVTAVVITAYVFVFRTDSSAIHPLLFLIIIMSQISAGMGERHGLQWRTPRSKGWYVVLTVVLAVAVIGSFFLILLSPGHGPLWVSFIPGALLLIGFGGLGLVQLWKARGSERVIREPREPLPLATRIATAVLGLFLGGATLSIGIRDGLGASLVMLAMMLIIIGWFFAWTTDAGPASLGRYWRWPQFAAYGAGMAVIIWLSLQSAYAGDVPIPIRLGAGALVALLMIGSAFMPESNRRTASSEAS